MVGSDGGGMHFLRVNMCYVELSPQLTGFPKGEAEIALEPGPQTPHGVQVGGCLGR